MRRYFRLGVIFFPLLLSAQKKPFTVEVLLQIQRMGDPQISPDGKAVAFSVSVPDLNLNKSATSVWAVSITGTPPARKLVDQAERPRWSNDGKRIFYTSSAGDVSQIWSMNPDGTGAKQITTLAGGASGEMLSADGRFMLITSDIYPECAADDACNKKKIDEAKQRKTQAHLVSSLLFRNWKTWQGDTRSHILSVSLLDGTTVDLSPGELVTPPFSLGGPDNYAISPDSREVAFARNADPNPATGTNDEIYRVPIRGGAAVKVSTSPGADNSPVYSPDGKYLAWRSQSRAGYESDRWRLAVMNRATSAITLPADSLDRQVTGFAWAPDSKSILFTAVDHGVQAIQSIGVTGGAIRIVVSGKAFLDDFQISADGQILVFTKQDGGSPVTICRAPFSGGVPVPITHLNESLLAGYHLTPFESFNVTGAGNIRIQSFIVKPPDFNPAHKYPAIMLIHGGPQGEWAENWTYRWNAQVFAGAGYVVVMPNPTGSIGYGQKFTDDINRDWGGKPYADIMAVTDAVAALPYVDASRLTAAGGSYGGYMVNWILGHTTRFRALISHAGVYDTRAEAESTEQLWFPMWEFGGMPSDNPEVYDRWSPSRFAKSFKTPTLVIHGELDYRIPYSQGLQLFTSLQLAKVPSQLLDFPDEGHWVLKPHNSLLWYRTFLDWMGKWTK